MYDFDSIFLTTVHPINLTFGRIIAEVPVTISLVDPNAKPRLGVRNNKSVYLGGISGVRLERSQGREQEAEAG